MINLSVVIFFKRLLGGNWSLIVTWKTFLFAVFKLISSVKCAEYSGKNISAYFVFITEKCNVTCTKQTKLMVAWAYACQGIGASRSQPPTPTSCLQTGRKNPSLLAFSVPNLFLNLELNWVVWNEENILPSCWRCCCCQNLAYCINGLVPVALSLISPQLTCLICFGVSAANMLLLIIVV